MPIFGKFRFPLAGYLYGVIDFHVNCAGGNFDDLGLIHVFRKCNSQEAARALSSETAVSFPIRLQQHC